MTDYATLFEAQLWAARIIHSRPPDQTIGDDPDNLYLKRWFLTPRSPHGNVYLHVILRSDDDRALHDHPWDNSSLIIDGGYFEHAPGGIVIWREPGWSGDRKAGQAHRLELDHQDGRNVPCVSLFMTGPKVREWGFHCDGGWRHWEEFDVKGCDA